MRLSENSVSFIALIVNPRKHIFDADLASVPQESCPLLPVPNDGLRSLSHEAVYVLSLARSLAFVIVLSAMNHVTVTFQDGSRMECPTGTEVGSLARPSEPDSGLPLVGALVNNDVSSLSYPLTVNTNVNFLTMADPHGWRIYRRSLCFLLAKAVTDLYPSARFRVEHSFGLGLYCSFCQDASGKESISGDQLRKIESRMRELVKRRIPIERRKIAFTDAVREFEKAEQKDKLNLLKYRNPPRVVIHWCDGFTDLAHGPLVPDTGVLDLFRLIPYKPGFVLHLPDRENPRKIPHFEDQPHLFQIFREYKEWGRILGVDTVGRLNEIIASGEIEHFVQTAEALHEKKLGRIADQISEIRDKIRIILVAGPSSSGKTTFAKRLTTHLRVNGLRPVTMSMDDYFVTAEKNPRDEKGNLDYEHIKAVDLELFNNHLLRLIKGEEIQPPSFDFKTKQRHRTGEKTRIDRDQMVIIEGIHGLNPELTHMIHDDCKFRIYVSALTQLSVDSNNRISTTDDRLMRRIVRDHRFRGHAALETLRLWTSVRSGEKKWIFPYQREADATFNSALDYELAVLKPLVEPLLMEIKPANAEYAEARRLSEFLLNFLGTSEQSVPGISILREYIGASRFRY